MTGFRPSFRLAMIGVIALSFALTACGRRGPLDPPPRSAANAAPAAQPQTAQTRGEDEDGNPVAPPGQKKGFLLDWLLN